MEQSYLDNLVIMTAELGNDAGLLGSLAQAKFKFTQSR
jgi:hypothetical protein